MFYYPTLLKTPNLVNLQVVFPGGWGTLKDDNVGLHFLWETFFFAPTAEIEDVDKWLWEHTLDFWSVTSFESIRLNFTLHQDQIEAFVPGLKAMLQPRAVKLDFINQEIQDLQNYWHTDRDHKEDQVLRKLFPGQAVVHPNPNLIDDLKPEHLHAIKPLWEDTTPHIIILGTVDTDNLIALSEIFPQKNNLETLNRYQAPTGCDEFFTATRWGLKFKLAASHLFELIVIELWEQQFKAKFFFEYHRNDLFIWTNEIEQPKVLASKVKTYKLNETDFENALQAYLKFLTQLYQGENSKNLEKLAELTEGLHAHSFQSPTFGIDPHNLNLAETLQNLNFETFQTFYHAFVAPLKTK